MIGGGPLESLDRIFTQPNMTSELPPGLRTNVLKMLDPVLEKPLGVVAAMLPDFNRFDFANHVSYGFNISGDLLRAVHSAGVGVPAAGACGRVSVSQDARGGRMNPHRAFVRKIVYVVAIGVLLFPLYWLGHPATSASKEAKGRSGGKLAQIREDYHISQADLGQIDLTNETVKLATLGMRGIAADILWWKASKFQMKKDWTNLSDTLEQITKVQPNFIGPGGSKPGTCPTTCPSRSTFPPTNMPG